MCLPHEGSHCCVTCAVSVVVPVLNEIASLPQLLNALKSQSFRPREILIVDAGSTDGSAAFVEGWWRAEQWDGGDCRVLIVPGAMPGGGRNAGVRAASQEWIAFIDAGIEPEPTWLERLCLCAQSQNAPAVFGMCRFSADGIFERALCALSHGQGAVHSVVPASLFNRRVFDEIGWFSEQLRAAEDLNWSKRLATRYGPRMVCPDAIVRYTHFPSTVVGAIRKWKLAESQSVLAGVRLWQQIFFVLGLLCVYGALVVGRGAWGWVVLAYVLGRGVLGPVLRSAEHPWWGTRPLALMIAPPLAVALDLAKLAGIFQGYLGNLLLSRNVRV